MFHRCIYDEYGLCFECNKKMPKPDLNKRLRDYRNNRGFVEVRLWVTEAQRKALKKKYPTPILPRDYAEDDKQND